MIVAAACALCGVLALNPSPSPSPSAPPEIAHVYTSDRSDTTLRNTARTVYLVKRQDIERNGYRTVAQALQGLPALVVSPLGPIGSGVNVTLRGSGSAQTLVLIDGLPAPGSFSNSAELGNLPTTGVERIEVVEGGGSTLYGSGAIGGIVNIITQRGARSSAALRAGSLGDREVEIALPNIQFERIVSYNGFALPSGLTRDDVDYQSSALHGDLERRIGGFDATLRAGIEADHLGAPGPIGFVTRSARENDVNGNADLTLARKSAQGEFTLQTGATMQHIVFACDASSDPNCFQPQAALNTESRFSLDLRNAVSGKEEQLLYGIDLSRGWVRSDDGAAHVAVAGMAQAAAYLQEHADAHWGSYYAGLRAERDGALGGEISPSAGLVWRLTPQLGLKANAATAFRAPNATELYFPGYGNPSLRAERAQVADVTLDDSSLLGGASIGWFGNRTRDLIVPEPVSAPGPKCAIDPSSYTYQACNIGHSFIEGLTFTVRAPISKGLSSSLNLTDLYRAQDLDTGARLPNDPVFTANLRFDYEAAAQRGLLDAAGLSARAQGKRGFADPAKPAFEEPIAFTAVDAYVRLRAGARMMLTLRAFNLGNERYSAVGGFPLPGRTYALELSAR